VGTITIKQGCRLVTKESTVQTPLITTSTNIISPKIINFKAINLSYTIPNIESEEGSKIENNKGTLTVTKIKEALDSQIPLFTNEDQILMYVDERYGLFSTNFWWNILLTVSVVFAISLTIRALLNFDYGRILRIRRQIPKEDHGEVAEMQKLNPEPHEIA
jgi:hypothetical protein